MMPRAGRPDQQEDPIALLREWCREASTSGAPSRPDAIQSAELPGDVAPGDLLDGASERFGSGEVPRPPHWGGYVVLPDRIEFLIFEDSRATAASCTSVTAGNGRLRSCSPRRSHQRARPPNLAEFDSDLQRLTRTAPGSR